MFCLSTGFGLGPLGDEYADWVRARLNRVYALNRKVVADGDLLFVVLSSARNVNVIAPSMVVFT